MEVLAPAHLETAYLDFYAATRIANHVIPAETEESLDSTIL